MTCGLGFSGRRNVSNGQSHSEKRVVVFVGRFLADWWLVIIGGSCHKDHFNCDKKRFLSRQTYFCRDKRLSRQIFIATNIILLTRQAYFYRDKHMFVATNICRNKSFVAASILLSRKKGMFFCDKHVSVATKIILILLNYWRELLPPIIVGLPQDNKGSVT